MMNGEAVWTIPSPLQSIHHPLLERYRVNLSIKREDLIHHTISGNKWRKLKYNLIHARKRGVNLLITFGGAFSNHIYSTAAACKYFNLPLLIYLRGDHIDTHNPTLNFVQAHGAKIRLLSREEYRLKDSDRFLKEIKNEFPNALIVPEGGSNSLAIEGLKELGQELTVQMERSYDFLLVSAGTGCTAAGIIQSVPNEMRIEVYSALKGNFLIKDIQSYLSKEFNNWSLIQDFHFGGYAKTNESLINFINEFKRSTSICLDPIYTAKAMYGFFDRLQKGSYPKGSNVVFVHTGGLQGIKGYNYLNPHFQIVD